MNEIASEVLGLAVGSSVNYAQAAAQVVDFYLDPARKNERAEIERLIKLEDAESQELLRGYVREAQRTYHNSKHKIDRWLTRPILSIGLNPQGAGLTRMAALPATIPLENKNGDVVNVEKGDIVFNSFRNAHLDVRRS